VPKQASLMEHGVAATAITISSRAKKTEPPKLTAVILKLEPSIYGRCSLCNRWTILRFCLEYFNNEGDMLLWGEICEDCGKALSEKLRERAPSKVASGDMLRVLRDRFPDKFVDVEFSDFVLKQGWTQTEAKSFLKILEKDGAILKIGEGWRWA